MYNVYKYKYPNRKIQYINCTALKCLQIAVLADIPPPPPRVNIYEEKIINGELWSFPLGKTKKIEMKVSFFSFYINNSQILIFHVIMSLRYETFSFSES